MDQDLRQKLFTDFPRLYRDRDELRSNMRFGPECRNGWFLLIYNLSKAISELDPEVKAVQVKEKFGSLRFYTETVPSEEVGALIAEAERKSSITCEWCGEPNAQLCLRSSWLTTMCESCRVKEQAEPYDSPF